MRFDPPLRRGRLIRRYKRFFADLELEGIGEVVAHCPNTGSLRGCLVEGAPVLAHFADDPKRRLQWTWAAVEIDGTWIGVWSAKAEAIVAEAIAGGALLPELAGYERMTTQVAYGADGARSRIDLLLSRGGAPAPGGRGARRPYVGDERVYVEVKSTTMRLAPGIAAFPDAVTERGRKHLEDLRGVVAAGHRAALVLIVQRGDCPRFAPADAVDPAWGAELRRSIAAGVEVYALRARVDAEALEARARMELVLDLPRAAARTA
ncbi:MAG: DNA/RNA nuclease SfsA [Nannocystaceae bacterium]